MNVFSRRGEKLWFNRLIESSIPLACCIAVGVGTAVLTLYGATLGSRLLYLWGSITGGLFLVLLFVLRRDEITAAIIIGVHLYIDWYLGIYVLGLALTLLLLVACFLARSPRFPWAIPRFLWLWGLFLALTILPAIQGATNLYDGTLYYPNDIFGALLIFWLGTVIARRHVNLKHLFMWLAFFGTLVAIHTIIQEITGKFLLETSSATATLASVSDYQLGISGIDRVGSFFVDPNWDGTFLAMMLAVALGLFVESVSLLSKIVYLSEMGLLLLAMVFTFSTGALLGALAGFAVFVLLVSYWRYRLLLAAVALTGAVIIIEFFPKEITLFLQHSSDPSELLLRTGAWQTALRVIQAFPLTGVGLGLQNYAARAEPYRVPTQFIPLVHPHDSYLELAAMAGLPVLLVFLALLLSALWLAWRNWRVADQRTRALLAAGIAAIAALSANSISINGWTLPPLAALGWLILGACSSSLLASSLISQRAQDVSVR